MGSRSHDIGAEIRMHSFTVNCDRFSNETKFAVDVQVTSVEATGSEANACSTFLYFVGEVFDDKTGKFSTRVNGWQYFRWMCI